MKTLVLASVLLAAPAAAQRPPVIPQPTMPSGTIARPRGPANVERPNHTIPSSRAAESNGAGNGA